MSKNTEIQPLTPLSSSVESSSLSSSSSQFTIKSPPSWHRSAKSRSFRKTIRALPRSPRKKNCVKSFASIFNLRIQFENNGRPKYELSKSERPWVKKIFKRPDITYTTAGKNQQKYLGKINGQSQYAQIRYLLWNLKVLLHILNGNATIDSERFLSKFSKDITFRQMYDFIKIHPEFVCNKDIPQSSCLCEVCENAAFVTKSIGSLKN